jgi:hypothetical protein
MPERRSSLLKTSMKNYSLFLLTGLMVIMAACNNHEEMHNAKTTRSAEDSLLDKVNEGHEVAMANMGKLDRAREQVTHLIDSLKELPVKAQREAAPLREKLTLLLFDLESSYNSMNKWMDEFEPDSAIADAKQKVDYFMKENEKVTQIKDAILSSLRHADSTLKRNF